MDRAEPSGSSFFYRQEPGVIRAGKIRLIPNHLNIITYHNRQLPEFSRCTFIKHTMKREEIIQAIAEDKMMPFIQPGQLAQIVDFVIERASYQKD